MNNNAQMTQNFINMNTHIHNLSAYIINHRRRMVDIELQISKLIGEYKLSSDFDEKSSNDFEDETYMFFFNDDEVPANNIEKVDDKVNGTANTNADTAIYCRLRKYIPSEFVLYNKFKSYGDIKSINIKKRQKYAFITFTNTDSAFSSTSFSDEDIALCQLANKRVNHLSNQGVSHDANNSETIVCDIPDRKVPMNKFHAYETFQKYGEVRNINVHVMKRLVFVTFKSSSDATALIDKSLDCYSNIRWPINKLKPKAVQLASDGSNELQHKAKYAKSSKSASHSNQQLASNSSINNNSNEINKKSTNQQSTSNSSNNNNSNEINTKRRRNNPFIRQNNEQNIDYIESVQVCIANPSCSIHDMKTIILEKFDKIESNTSLISVKEEINQNHDKILNLIIKFSKIVSKRKILSLNLHPSWQIKFLKLKENGKIFFRSHY